MSRARHNCGPTHLNAFGYAVNNQDYCREARTDTNAPPPHRGGLISEKFRGNHPHSDSAFEGDMSDALREELYQCNAMDTLLVKTAIKRHNEIVAEQATAASAGCER